jgi:hypothetical protein
MNLRIPARPCNLLDPVAGDHGARGRFDDRARAFSPQLWTDLHRDGVMVFVLLGALSLGSILFGRTLLLSSTATESFGEKGSRLAAERLERKPS